jgi:hypothetical protein
MESDGVEKLIGYKWIGYMPPQLSIFTRSYPRSDEYSDSQVDILIPALLTRSSACHTRVLDAYERARQVYELFHTPQNVFGGEGDD